MVSLKVKEISCIVYSTLLFASGVVLIGLSVVLSYKLFYHFEFVPSNALGPFIVIFILGFLHLFLTWLGVKGPTREHDLHIILFMVFTLILLIIELTIGIWSIIIWDEIDIESLNLMRESFDGLINNNYNKKDWARMETTFHCCGLNGVEDYKKNKDFIPISCCDVDRANVTCSQVYEKGCILPLTRYIKSVMVDGAIIGFLLCILQCLGLAAFFLYFKSLRQERIERRRQIMLRQEAQAAMAVAPAATPPPTTTTASS